MALRARSTLLFLDEQINQLLILLPKSLVLLYKISLVYGSLLF